ncbi:elongation factor G [bacterium]|nr:elongation factor G [bacterium]
MARTIPIEKIRNIGIIAHIDAGKTTTTERMLFYSGYLHKIGEVDEGTAFMDYMEQERERGITIMSAAVTTFWQNYQVNIIDTPGHVDFTSEVQRSLRVLDGSIAVLCAVDGVEPQTERVWHQADEFNVPRIAYINKMDRMGADFDRVLQMMIDKLAANPIAVQIPIGAEENFEGIIDLIKMKAYYFDVQKMGAEYEISDIPENMLEIAQKYHAQMIEKITEFDDSILEKYLSSEEIYEDEIKSSLRKGTISLNCVPVFCGSSLKNVGVQTLLDGVIDYLPSPSDIGFVEGADANALDKIIKVRLTDEEPFSALSFKVLSDSFVGRLNFVRIYSGVLKVGQIVENSTINKKERVSKIFRIYSNKREEIQEVYSGEIVAIPSLKFTSTGDTLCNGRMVIYDKIRFLDPVIDMSLEAKTQAEQEKMLQALSKLSDEDPTFRFKFDDENGQIIISGVGELQLEIAVDRLKTEFNLAARSGKPQVSYKETINQSASSDYHFERIIAGKNQIGDVSVEISPNERGKGLVVENTIDNKAIPKFLIDAAMNGISEAIQMGLHGYPLLDVVVKLIKIEYIEGSTTETGIKIAGSIAVKNALNKIGTVLLEPIFKVEIVSPEQYVGDIISDLNARKGRIEGIDSKGNLQIVIGYAPLSNLFGYVTDLRSLSQGRASFTMVFSHYNTINNMNFV